ncbi:MAG: hypothetical protein ACR2NW_10690 [Thermodesulfobacteriota bacterium]
MKQRQKIMIKYILFIFTLVLFITLPYHLDLSAVLDSIYGNGEANEVAYAIYVLFSSLT